MKIPWRKKWQPTPVFWPEESHGQRSLVGYSPRSRKESDTTERLMLSFSLSNEQPWQEWPLSWNSVGKCMACGTAMSSSLACVEEVTASSLTLHFQWSLLGRGRLSWCGRCSHLIITHRHSSKPSLQGWFMSMYDKNHYNIVKLLASN